MYGGDVMTIGERIKYTRESKGISQVDLANAVNVSKQSLYKYENNIITNIPSDKIEAISTFLGVSPAYLMGWEEIENKRKTIESLLDQKPHQAVIMYKDGNGKQETKELSEEQYKKVLKFLDMLDN